MFAKQASPPRGLALEVDRQIVDDPSQPRSGVGFGKGFLEGEEKCLLHDIRRGPTWRGGAARSRAAPAERRGSRRESLRTALPRSAGRRARFPCFPVAWPCPSDGSATDQRSAISDQRPSRPWRMGLRAIARAAFTAASTPDFSRIFLIFARVVLGSWRTAAM